MAQNGENKEGSHDLDPFPALGETSIPLSCAWL